LSKEEAFKYAEAVVTYLTLALLKYELYNSITTWLHPGNPWGVDVSPSLPDRGIAMNWNWCEINLFVDKGVSGVFKNPISFVNAIRSQIRAIEYLSAPLLNTAPKGTNLLDDATILSKLNPNDKFDLIVTDPPYYDDVPYSELSDFYYVWLKRALSDVKGNRFHALFPEHSSKNLAKTTLKSQLNGRNSL